MTETSTERFFPYCSILMSPERVFPSPENPCLTCLKIHIFLMKFITSLPKSRFLFYYICLGRAFFAFFWRNSDNFSEKIFFIFFRYNFLPFLEKSSNFIEFFEISKKILRSVIIDIGQVFRGKTYPQKRRTQPKGYARFLHDKKPSFNGYQHF